MTPAETRHASVMTVLGPKDQSELGLVLPHEHIIIDASAFYVPPDQADQQALGREPVGLNNLSWVRYNARHSRDCLRMTDTNAALHEVTVFGRAGGKTIVDLTACEMGRNPAALARISEASGVNIIMGVGYYTADTHPPETSMASAETLAERMIDEITTGVNGTGVEAGIIGEIGCSWPLKPLERKVLEASAIAQQITGVAVNIHPSRNESGPVEAMEVMSASGADLNRAVISHMDRCGYLLETRLELLEGGCYLEYDLFGKEGYYPIAPALVDNHLPDMPNDVGRIKEIAELIELGWLHKILISHDHCLKINYTQWGGPGFAHIIQRVIPYMRVYGYTEQQIQQLTVVNPACMLTGS